MGGVSSLVATHLADALGGADAVEVSIRWELRNRAGADSVEFTDRLGLDYEVIEAGRWYTRTPLSVRHVQIGDTSTRVARIDTLEQFTLPSSLGTGTAVTRIGFSSAATTSALLTIKRVGFSGGAAATASLVLGGP